MGQSAVSVHDSGFSSPKPKRAEASNATSRDVIGTAVELTIFGQPLDTRAKRLEKLQSLTREQVNDAIKRRFKPETLRFYVLGDPAGFGETKLESLGKVTPVKG